MNKVVVGGGRFDGWKWSRIIHKISALYHDTKIIWNHSHTHPLGNYSSQRDNGPSITICQHDSLLTITHNQTINGLPSQNVVTAAQLTRYCKYSNNRNVGTILKMASALSTWQILAGRSSTGAARCPRSASGAGHHWRSQRAAGDLQEARRKRQTTHRQHRTKTSQRNKVLLGKMTILKLWQADLFRWINAFK